MQCSVCGSNVSRIKYDLDAKLVFGCRQCGLVPAKAKHGQPEVRLESSGQEESHREKCLSQFWEFRRKSFRRGIEASPVEIRFCKERFGIDVEQANINQAVGGIETYILQILTHLDRSRFVCEQ